MSGRADAGAASARRPRGAAPAVIAAACFALAGCKVEGKAFACECEMLTDFDDAHKQEVKVCAQSPEEAPGAARGCAQLAAPMPVQSCTCTAVAGAPVCREGCLE